MNNKNETPEIIRHGECLLIPIANLPADAVKATVQSEVVVAHSETGHNHVAVGERLTTFKGFDTLKLREQLREQLYGHAAITGLLKVDSPTQLEHRKSFDAHPTVDIPQGLYVIVTKTHYDYFEKLQKRTQD